MKMLGSSTSMKMLGSSTFQQALARPHSIQMFVRVCMRVSVRECVGAVCEHSVRFRVCVCVCVCESVYMSA